MEKSPRFLQGERLTWKSKLLKLIAVVIGLGLVYQLTGGCPYAALTNGKEHTDINVYEEINKALKVNLAEQWSHAYTNESHLAGENQRLVEFTRAKFEDAGFESSIDNYEVYLSKPIDHGLWLRKGEKTIYEAPLTEDALDKDETSKKNTVPTFVGYGANGNVTAEYIYGSYCSLDDFAELTHRNVVVKGKVVVCRYGGIFRGLKVKFAQDNGAVGVLLYTDPGDDHGITPANGFKQYPHGPARHELSVQRGSVQFLGGIGAAPGDPTTPGIPLKPGVDRVDPHNSIGKIPVLPVSYRDIKPILEKLNGHGERIGKVGGLSTFDYTTGPNPKFEVNVYLNQKFGIETITNVYGELKGKNSHEVIIVGNHRDAWIKGGAGDPNLGLAVLLEVARALGTLKGLGYKFKRTIVLHLYDGEEYGLLGLTEGGEYYANEYKKKVISYVNLDSAVTGSNFHLSALPLLNEILLKVAAHVEHPKGGTLLENFNARNGRIGHLGSGSDYTVFLEHLGIPLADIGFSGTKGDAVYQYHSNYDLFHWMKTYGDPGFVYHNVAAHYVATLVAALADHKVVPFGTADYARALSTYFEKVRHSVKEKWLDRKVKTTGGCGKSNRPHGVMSKHMNAHMASHNNKQMGWKHGSSHKKPHHKPHNDTLANLLTQVSHGLYDFEKVAKKFDQTTQELEHKARHRDQLSWWKRIKLHFLLGLHNGKLKAIEQSFLVEEGLYKRPWFKHQVFAAGRFTGYAGQTLPGLTEAIEDDDYERFVKWVYLLRNAVNSATEILD